METLEKIRDETNERAETHVNESGKLIHSIKEAEKDEKILPRLASKAETTEDIKRIEAQISFLKAYGEKEDHLHREDAKYIPLAEQLAQRNSELLDFKKEKKTWFKKITSRFGL